MKNLAAKEIRDLRQLFLGSEAWLLDRVRRHVRDIGHGAYAPTLVTARKIALGGIARTLAEVMDTILDEPVFSYDIEPQDDPVTKFCAGKAREHLQRGVTVGMFLGILKCYRRSFHDLIGEHELPPGEKERGREIVERFFDRVEIATCTQWCGLTEEDKLAQLQEGNRRLTNEKNKFVTIFESLRDPVILLDREGRIDSFNQAAATLFGVSDTPGASYYGRLLAGEKIPWLADAMPDLSRYDSARTFEISRDTASGVRHFQVKLKRMLDVSDRYAGTVVMLNDVTDLKRIEEELRRYQEQLETMVFTRTHELSEANERLRRELEARRQAEEELRTYQKELSSLAAELSLAAERERRRIAGELHDQVGQSLAFAKIGLNGLVQSVPDQELRGRIRDIGTILDQAIQDVRSLTVQISPPLLYEVGLEAALESLGEHFQDRFGFRVTFLDDGEPKPLPEELRVTLYQVVRELLVNVAKHAGARNAAVGIRKIPGSVELWVEDDGKGFAVEDVLRPGAGKKSFGLFSIRERLRHLGCEIRISSKPGAGTRTTIRVPLHAP
ncbi:histidine kinase [Geobacter sp.]|uniref:sensor histidine kinase n=1 Tax=Geobacter sp. TaxID=46610 RepID=UPI0026185A02|nr:histidine kinase [Geobacter sp.]